MATFIALAKTEYFCICGLSKILSSEIFFVYGISSTIALIHYHSNENHPWVTISCGTQLHVLVTMPNLSALVAIHVSPKNYKLRKNISGLEWRSNPHTQTDKTMM